MPALTEKAIEYYVNNGMNERNKKFMPDKGSEISLPNNEIKDHKSDKFSKKFTCRKG